METIDPGTVHPQLSALVDKIAACGARRVIIFGSRARKTNSARADIDMAVEGIERDEDWFRITDMVEQAQTLLEIDCIRFETAPAALQDQIIKDGRLLYGG